MYKEYYIKTSTKSYFRLYGQGPPILLFHPSPSNSKSMTPLAMELANRFTVISPDTPGYGRSEGLSVDSPTMQDFAESFHSFIDSLGVDKCAIYGSATGAQLAIRFGLSYPDKVSNLFLDNCAHFTDQERTDILKHYFPDLSPKHDGSHLVMIWKMVTNLFKYFPWCFEDEEHKLDSPSPPANILTDIAIEYLIAGAAYDKAYKAAFEHEKVEYIQQLNIPTTIFRWQGSIIKKYNDRLFEYDLPSCVDAYDVPADRTLRYHTLAECIKSKYSSGSGFDHDVLTSDHIELQISSTDKSQLLGLGNFPEPDKDGLHLIKAWHQLKDKRFLSKEITDTQIDNSDYADQLQEELINWYTY